MTETFGVEKRKHIRVPLSYVTVDVLSVTGEISTSETTTVLDISESGMRFSGNIAYTIRQEIVITFIIPNTEIPIKTKALVVHQQKQTTGFQTGLYFKGMTLAEFTVLKNYIEEKLINN